MAFNMFTFPLPQHLLELKDRWLADSRRVAMGAGARSAEQFSANQTESYEEYVKISQLIDETKVDIAR